MEPKDDKKPWWETFLFKCLVVLMAFVGILLLLKQPGPSRRPPKIAMSKTQIATLVAALNQYMTQYSKLPLPQSLQMTNQTSNFTFGTYSTSAQALGITNANGYQANNSYLIAALMDLEKFENGKATPNANHCLNPQHIVFLNARMSPDTNSSGVGPDCVYRDPWGNPYIISINVDSRTNCLDAFYRLASVSEANSGQAGLNGLFRPSLPPYTNSESRDSFAASSTVMVWSLGPDGKADRSQKANQGVNKDNITSW